MNLRLEKFSSLIKKELARVLLDYQTPQASISVNSIKISPDLKIAHAYVSLWGRDADSVFQAIDSNTGDISRQVASKLKSKFSPKLKFHLDTGQTEAERIQSLLNK